jgi:hypothetical protein
MQAANFRLEPTRLWYSTGGGGLVEEGDQFAVEVFQVQRAGLGVANHPGAAAHANGLPASFKDGAVMEVVAFIAPQERA